MNEDAKKLIPVGILYVISMVLIYVRAMHIFPVDTETNTLLTPTWFIFVLLFEPAIFAFGVVFTPWRRIFRWIAGKVRKADADVVEPVFPAPGEQTPAEPEGSSASDTSKKINTVMIPDDHFSLQDSRQSLVDSKGRYDPTRFSDNEQRTILAVIDSANRKYPSDLRSIGLFNEAAPIIYKARSILMQVIVEKYEASPAKLDQFAVACAYAEQGAYCRKKALEFFEAAGGVIPSQAGNMLYTLPLSVYNKFSKLYESEHQYNAAIHYLLLAKPFAPVEASNYYVTKLAQLQAKVENPPARRNRTLPAETIEYHRALSEAAQIFVPLIK